MSGFLIAVVASVLAGLVVVELQGGLPRLARHLVQRAAGRLPSPHDARWRDEWLDHLDGMNLPPIASLVYAMKIFRGAAEIRTDLCPRRPRSVWAGALVRRFVDVAMSTLALVLFAPPMFVIAIAIKLDSPGPTLVRRVRVGRDGDLFPLYTFRTAAIVEDSVSGKQVRKTRVGRFLWRTSLSELPQLLSVVKGDMSLFGPTPGAPFMGSPDPAVKPGIAPADDPRLWATMPRPLRILRPVIRLVWRRIPE